MEFWILRGVVSEQFDQVALNLGFWLDIARTTNNDLKYNGG